MPQCLAIFDIDGTIFRSSLQMELTEALIQAGIFSAQMRETYIRQYKKWLDRQDSYDRYIEAAVVAFNQNIKGVKRDDFLAIAEQVVAFHQNRVYRYTRDLVKDLREQDFYLVALSHSPTEIVEKFCQNLGFKRMFGRTREVDKQGRFTGEILGDRSPNGKDKLLRQVLEEEKLTLKESVGVGDSETDIPFLQLVERPICFNPNTILFDHAKKYGWEVVVERKDVIYNIQ